MSAGRSSSGIAAPPVVTVRPMAPDDFPAVSRLSRSLGSGSLAARALGRPHRQEDWEFLLEQGQGLVATLPDGRIVGAVSWWRFGERHASIRLVIVDNAWHGHGIGRQLMTKMRKCLPGCALVLNTTSAGRPFYERFGFVPVGVVEQHQGCGVSAPIVPLQPGERLRPLVSLDIEAVVTLDRAALGMDRRELIEHLVRSAKGVVIDAGNSLRGYAFCLKFGWGWLIGPAAAHDVEQARALAAHWIGTHGGEFLRIDIPGGCGLSSWLDEMGLVQVDIVNSMGTAPRVPAGTGPVHYFALAAQAVG